MEYKDGPDPGGDGFYLVSEPVLFYANCMEEGLLVKPKPEYLSWEVDGQNFIHDGEGSLYLTGAGGGFELVIVDAGDEGEFLFATFHDIGPHVVRMICDNANDDTEDDDDLVVPLEVVVCLDDSYCDDGNAYTGEETCSAEHQCLPGVPSCDEGVLEYCDGLDHPDCPGAWTCVLQECYWDCEGPNPCETAADCNEPNLATCPGDWTCVEGVCLWLCEAGYCQTPLDCDGLDHEDCIGFWGCANGECQWTCNDTIGTCEIALDCDIQPLAPPLCKQGDWTCIQGVCQYQCIVPDDDIDQDGLLGESDPCPYDPYNDIDGDSICGDVDNCPWAANEDQADEDGNGKGDVCDWEDAFEVTLLQDPPPGQIGLHVKIHRYEVSEVEVDGVTYVSVAIDGTMPRCGRGEPALPNDAVVLQVPIEIGSVSLVVPAQGGGPVQNIVSELYQGSPVPCEIMDSDDVVFQGEDPEIYNRSAIPFPLSPVRLLQPVPHHNRGLVTLILNPVIFHSAPDSADHMIEIFTEFDFFVDVGAFTPDEPDDPYYLPADVYAQFSAEIENFEFMPGEEVAEAARVLVVGETDMLQRFSDSYLELEHKGTCFTGYTVIGDPDDPDDDYLCYIGGADADGLTWEYLDIADFGDNIGATELKGEIRQHWYEPTVGSANPLRYVLILGSDEFVPLAMPEHTGLLGTNWDRFVWVEISGEYRFDKDYPYILLDYNARSTPGRHVYMQFAHDFQGMTCSALPADVECGTSLLLKENKTVFRTPVDLAELIAHPQDMLNLTKKEIKKKYASTSNIMFPVEIGNSTGVFDYEYGPTWDRAVTCDGSDGCQETGDWVPFTLRFYVGTATGSYGWLGLKTAMARQETVEADSFWDALYAPRLFTEEDVRLDETEGSEGKLRLRIWRAHPSDPDNNDIDTFPFADCDSEGGCVEQVVGWNDLHQVEYTENKNQDNEESVVQLQQGYSGFACKKDGAYYGHWWDKTGERFTSFLNKGGGRLAPPPSTCCGHHS